MSVLEQEISPAALREDWLQAVDRLFADVEQWAEEWLLTRGGPATGGWLTRRLETEIREDFGSGRYSAPVLEINAPPREVRLVPEEKIILEPIAYNVFGGKGRVDFYAWPTMYTVRMLRQPYANQWTIATDSGIAWPHGWGKATFIELAEGLLEA